jgi:hypothetical protein
MYEIMLRDPPHFIGFVRNRKIEFITLIPIIYVMCSAAYLYRVIHIIFFPCFLICVNVHLFPSTVREIQ